MTLTVRNNSAVLLTGGGIHYDLDRIRPNVYAGGYWIKIVADLSVSTQAPDRQQRRQQLQLGGDGTLTLLSMAAVGNLSVKALHTRRHAGNEPFENPDWLIRS